MSSSKAKTLADTIVEASQSLSYLLIVPSDKDDVLPEIKSEISLGGARTTRWKDGKQMSYYPKYRLAAQDSATIYTFMVANGLIKAATSKKPATFGPVIMRDNDSDEIAAKVTTEKVFIGADGQENLDSDAYTGSIPFYVITSEGDALSSAELEKADKMVFEIGDQDVDVQVNPSYPLEDYFNIEKDLRKKFDLATKGDSGKKVSFIDLANHLRDVAASTSKKGKKASGGGRKAKVVTMDSLMERVVEYRKKNKSGDKKYLDITGMLEDGTKAKIAVPTSSSVFALPNDNKYHEYFTLNAEISKTNDKGLAFYSYAADGDEGVAGEMKETALTENDRVLEKKASPKKKKDEKKKKETKVKAKSVAPKRTVARAAPVEEEEEEEEDVDADTE